MLGGVQTGKSAFIKSFINEDLDIELGDGRIECTKKTIFYPGTLKESDQEIIFIDT